MAVVVGPLLVYVVAGVTHNITTAGDAVRALGMLLVAEIVAALVAGSLVTQLKDQRVKAQDGALQRSIGRSLIVARFAFWPSMVLLLFVPLAMVFYLGLAFGLSG
jgi:hypothetical protein